MKLPRWLRKLRGSVDRPASNSAVASQGDSRGVTESGTQPAAGYSADQPIRSKEEDRFNRWPFAQRIAETLAARSDPSSLVIGIYAPWGDGKTSTLLMMEDALRPHAHVAVVRFNPWHFDSENQLLRGFFATLAEALGRSLPTRK